MATHAETELSLNEDFLSKEDQCNPPLSYKCVSGKTKIKWLGNLNELKVFISSKLNLTGSWSFTTNNGGFHVFKASLVTLSFYPGTKTLTVQGTKQEEIKKIIISLATEENNSTQQVPSQSSFKDDDQEHDKQDGVEDEAEENEVPIPNVADESSDSESESESEPEIVGVTSLSGCCNCKQITKALKGLQDKFTSLEQKVDNIKDHSYNNLLLKVKSLEAERDGLLIALKLMSNPTPSIQPATSAVPFTDAPFTGAPFQTGVEHRNNREHFKPKSNSKSKPNQAPSHPHVKDKPNNPDILIMGDSMTRPIIGKKLSRKCNVQSLSFPGAKVQDLADYIKPGLRRKPKNVIIHAGTNNLKSESPKAIQQKIKQLANNIKKDNPEIKVALSTIIKRKDDHSLNGKITKVNSSLRNFCQSNDIDFICNDNLDEDCLNRGGLHLNKKGILDLANNFRTYINNLSE